MYVRTYKLNAATVTKGDCGILRDRSSTKVLFMWTYKSTDGGQWSGNGIVQDHPQNPPPSSPKPPPDSVFPTGK